MAYPVDPRRSYVWFLENVTPFYRKSNGEGLKKLTFAWGAYKDGVVWKSGKMQA
jgi:hypothetical protein